MGELILDDLSDGEGEQLGREAGRVEVEQTKPGQTGQGKQFIQQRTQTVPFTQIRSPGRHILGHQRKFSDAAIQQGARFCGHFLFGR